MTFKAQIKASLGWDWNDGLRDNNRLEYAKGLTAGSGPESTGYGLLRRPPPVANICRPLRGLYDCGPHRHITFACGT